MRNATKFRWCRLLVFMSGLGCLLASSFVEAASVEDTLRVAPFGRVTVYHPSESPTQVVLFVSGDGGWNQGVVDMARELCGLRALVVGVDITRYMKQLAETEDACSYPAADFERLAQTVERRFGVPSYLTPLLVGYSSGATLVYAVLVQAPATTFKGAISLGFCPDLPLTKPLCPGSGLRCLPLPRGKGYEFLPASTLETPWIALQGMVDQDCDPARTQDYVAKVKKGEVVMLPKVGHGYSVVKNWMPQFKEAYQQVGAAPLAAGQETKVEALPDLPLVEVAASGPTRDVMALHLSGDGGWGVTDRGLSETLARSGIPVVGLNALHYFWTARTPDGAAADVEKVLRHYLAAWGKSRAVLIGYSFGADVMPFLVSRLPADLRARVAVVALLGPSEKADFKFHPGDWLDAPAADALPVPPELAKLGDLKVLCIYGRNDKESICAALPPGSVTSIEREGGHRIGGNFEDIAADILRALP